MAKDRESESEGRVLSLADYPGQFTSYEDEEFLTWALSLDMASRRNIAKEVADMMSDRHGIPQEVRDQVDKEFQDMLEHERDKLINFDYGTGFDYEKVRGEG